MSLLNKSVQLFTTYYPIIMTIVWLLGAWISGKKQPKSMITDKPTVTVLMAMYDEERTINETLTAFSQLTYPNFNVIIVDDKSTDQSVSITQQWLAKHPNFPLQLVKLSKNVGKAQALNEGLALVTTEYILATDADALLEPRAIEHLLKRIDQSNVGAVTGKPVVRNRTTLLGRLQALEYVGIIDRIKRAQDSFYGGIMTVAGVISLYRTCALKSVNGFDQTAMTEDIDITWRLRKAGWLIHYTPEALVYILVPETHRGYLKQRIRWSVGGLEVLVKNMGWVYRKTGRSSHKFLLLDMVFSHIWAWFAVITMVQFIVMTWVTSTLSLPGVILLIYILLFFMMFIQGVLQDKHASHLNLYDIFELPFYSTFYWFSALITALISQILVGFTHKQKGSWTSPDRGR